jgi:hypothetical protein
MFITYLRRELRRRMRQAIFIALGLALGIGLVITVTAASSGVSNSQGTVLHSLYGVGTDVTVTQTPTAGSGGPTRFGIGGGNSGSKPQAGTSFSRSVLTSGGLGALPSSDVTKISGLKDVSATAGALTLTDLELSGTISAGGSGTGAAGGSGASGGQSSIKTSSFSVTGVDLANGSLGPLSSGTITSGHNFSSADSTANVAVVDANYAKAENLKTESTGRMWVVLRPRLPGFDLVWAYGRGLGPGLTSESADAVSGCPANRSVGRVPGFPGTHRRCRPDLPCLDKRRGFTGPTASGCVPPLQPQKRDGIVHRRDTCNYRRRGHPC